MSQSISHQDFVSFRESVNEYVVGGVPYRPIVEVMYFYTRRANEVVTLTESDVDFDNGLITFPVHWRNFNSHLTFNLDPRIAGKLMAARQWNVLIQGASDDSLFGVSYNAVYQKIKDTSNELGIEILPKSVPKLRVEHLRDEGYHPEQIEYWMTSTPSRIEEKREIDSFIHDPLVLEQDNLAITSPDVPRHRDSYKPGTSPSRGVIWGHLPRPPVVKDCSRIGMRIAISRSLWGTIPYNVRKYIYFSDGTITQESLRDKVDSHSSLNGKQELERILELLVDSGEVNETTRGYEWDDEARYEE